jgi:ATP phosphoribosyltransferase regulatory subunit
MRDWLPQQARRRAIVSDRIMASLELFGYQRVEVPPFEYADVLEKGFANVEAAVRFVEPETGKIAALRSDVTPQIARLVTSRFPAGPWPARLCYQASVMRRRHERARLDQEVRQVGFELVGLPEPAGDLEMLETATSALRAAGLHEFTVDLAHAEVAGALLDQLAPGPRADALECLALKDSSELRHVGVRGGLLGRSLEALVALPSLHGDSDLWPRAEQALVGTAAEVPLRSLKSIWSRAVAARLAPRFVVDLGETREFYYYTGTMFHLLAEGPGEPLGSGGRYDSLFERFGLPSPAAGFAFDLSNVCWALDAAGVRDRPLDRVLVCADNADVGHELARALRSHGVVCALGPAAEPWAALSPKAPTDAGAEREAYAVRWDYTHLLALVGARGELKRLGSGSALPVDAKNVAELAHVVAAHLGVLEES